MGEFTNKVGELVGCRPVFCRIIHSRQKLKCRQIFDLSAPFALKNSISRQFLPLELKVEIIHS